MSVLTAEQLIAIRGSGLIDPSYANILDLLDTIDALREQIATAERRGRLKEAKHIHKHVCNCDSMDGRLCYIARRTVELQLEAAWKEGRE